MVAERVRRDHAREGGVGLNACTSADATDYFYSLPANKVELWAYLESERFLHPVFREFYKERDVVMEERRLRTESQPIGRLIEQFLATAFLAHPYKQPAVGYMSDLQRFTLTDAEAVLQRVLRAVQHGHGDRRRREGRPRSCRCWRSTSGASRRARSPAAAHGRAAADGRAHRQLREKAQPIYLEGYHKPSALHPDDAVYDAIAEILGARPHLAPLHARSSRSRSWPCRRRSAAGFRA